VIERGRVCWLLGPRPAARRPVLVIQADAFNRSAVPTVVVVPLAQDIRLLEAPGNVLVPARASGLKQDTVVVVSEIVTLERTQLSATPAVLQDELMKRVGEGLRLVIG
jgi:mRNA interferase MazF